MPTILVVDDSETDQMLVAGIINKAIKWNVEFSNDGETALELMDSNSPDLVVTDLNMPEMTGIELVQQAKIKHPEIPVILMTGLGNEMLAVKALKAGAASYIPKSSLADSLMDTLEQIWQMSNIAKSQDRIRKCITNSRLQFKLATDPDLIRPCVGFVKEIMTNHEFGDETIRRQVSVALEEALINAMFHGNLELRHPEAQAARRELHVGSTSEFVRERCQEKPYCQRTTTVDCNIERTEMQLKVSDEGPGFDISKLPPIEDLDNFSSPIIGRGLNLIGRLMDQIEFNETGNTIRMQLSDPMAC